MQILNDDVIHSVRQTVQLSNPLIVGKEEGGTVLLVFLPTAGYLDTSCVCLFPSTAHISRHCFMDSRFVNTQMFIIIESTLS